MKNKDLYISGTNLVVRSEPMKCSQCKLSTVLFLDKGDLCALCGKAEKQQLERLKASLDARKQACALRLVSITDEAKQIAKEFSSINQELGEIETRLVVIQEEALISARLEEEPITSFFMTGSFK